MRTPPFMPQSQNQWVVVLLLCSLGHEPCAGQTVLITDQSSTQRIDSLVVCAIVPPHFFTWAELHNPAQKWESVASYFQKPPRKQLHFATLDQNFLIRFKLENRSSQPQLTIFVRNPTQGFYCLWVRQANGKITKYITDIPNSLGLQHLKAGLISWDINAANGQPLDLYLLMGGGDVPKSYPMYVATKSNFEPIYEKNLLFWCLFFGLLGIVLFYNSLVYWAMRESVFVVYVGYLLSQLLFHLKSSGLGARFLWANWPAFGTHIPIIAAASLLFISLIFTITFLQTKRYDPLGHQLLVALLISCVVISVSMLAYKILFAPLNGFTSSFSDEHCALGLSVLQVGLGFFGGNIPFLKPYRGYLRPLGWMNLAQFFVFLFVISWGNFSAVGLVGSISCFGLCSIVGVRALRRHNPNAVFYGLGWGALLLAGIVYQLYTVGVLSYHFWVVNSLAVGTGIEAIVFTFGLAYRFRKTNADSQHSRAKLMQQVEENQQQQLQLRSNIARDLHDDMGSYLSSISIMSQNVEKMAQKNPKRAEESLKKIGETARKVMDSMGEIVWSISPEYDSMQHIIGRMKDTASELFSFQNTLVCFDISAEVLTLNLPLEKRRDFFLVFKEALTNAAKYSQAERVAISLQTKANCLTLCIEDNGVGFDIQQLPAPNGSGNGLKNMQARAEKLGGKLFIDTKIGVGSQVLLQFEL